ncbi:kinase-like domain-containing protein [Xylaria flabelliformis]|nr:kinase-like domain-containing protein [Xylaria flabelliformis]
MERSGRLDSNSSEWAPHSTSGEHKSSNSLSRTRKGDNCGADFLDILFTCDQCGIPSLCLGELGVAKSENERSFARENYSLGAGLTSQVKQHTTGPESTDAVPEGTLVALKLFTSRGGDDSVTARTNRREVCQLILREVEALCHPVLSSHPNIVRLLFIGWKVEESFPILAMELGSYGSLDHVIRGPGSGLTTSQKQHISIDIALGLHAIHEAGFIHGDLKPDNVIILAHDDPNRQLVAKILDFGGSSKRSHGKASAPAHTTKLWSAPEVLNCDSDVDWEKADVYSFGLIFASLWARLQHGGFGLHRFDQTSSCCLLEYVPSQVTDEVRYMMFWVMKSSPENGQNSLLHLLSSRLPRILPAEIRIADVLDILRATLKRYFWERISLGGLIQGLSFLAKDVGRDTL